MRLVESVGFRDGLTQAKECGNDGPRAGSEYLVEALAQWLFT